MATGSGWHSVDDKFHTNPLKTSH